MASVFDYKFNNPSRLGYDITDASQRAIQNISYSNRTFNTFIPSSPFVSAEEFATSQPNINFSGSRGLSIGGTNVDENSSLLLSDLSKFKCKINLSERAYLTVPYLGRGKCDVMVESQIQQGDFANNRKSINPASELCYSQYAQTPMIPELRSNITNSSHIIECDAVEGWMRGGLPSRELARDSDKVSPSTKH